MNVLIIRDSAEPSRRGRVFVTGPHFGSDYIYSSTSDREKASRFNREEAEGLLALGKWRNLNPAIEEAE